MIGHLQEPAPVRFEAGTATAPRVVPPAVEWQTIRQVTRWLSPICDHYFRSEVRGLERVPDRQTLLVCNHDGGNLPVDGICFAAAWHRHFDYQRPLRVLMHEIPFRLFGGLTRLLHRCGCVSASSAMFESVFDHGDSALLYPGAARESFRTFKNRRTIDLGGRTGFVERALRRGLTVTPVVSVGAHETMFILTRGQRMVRFFGIDKRFKADAWPLVAGIPLGLYFGPFPHLPLPAKITIEVLPPLDLASELERMLGRPIGPAQADEPRVVRAGFDLVHALMQGALHRLYAERRFPVLG